MPPYLPAAVVAVEDRRFWHHAGIDLIGMARAALTDLVAGHVVQGGSTLTQQVAKNLFLSNARTLRRKVQELLLTIWLEQHFTKQEILEIYLDRVYLGAGAWGMDAAARIYFGVSARHVTLWQAAVLAGLPRAPSRFNPRVNPGAATARAKEVLAAMVETGAITQAQAQAAAASIAFPPAPAIAAGWFADWAAAQAVQELSPNADATLHTTLDARLQAVAEARLAALLDKAGRSSGRDAGRRGDPGCRERRGARHGRRAGLSVRLVQPGGGGTAAARLGVQAVHLAECVAARADAGLHRAGCADPYRPLEPGELRAPL